jgi:hypothetical protein
MFVARLPGDGDDVEITCGFLVQSPLWPTSARAFRPSDSHHVDRPSPQGAGEGVVHEVPAREGDDLDEPGCGPLRAVRR